MPSRSSSDLLHPVARAPRDRPPQSGAAQRGLNALALDGTMRLDTHFWRERHGGDDRRKSIARSIPPTTPRHRTWSAAGQPKAADETVNEP
jgi:hypothetical protein